MEQRDGTGVTEQGLLLTRRAVLCAGCAVPAAGLLLAGDAASSGAVVELVVTDGTAPLLLTGDDGAAAPLIARCPAREFQRI